MVTLGAYHCRTVLQCDDTVRQCGRGLNGTPRCATSNSHTDIGALSVPARLPAPTNVVNQLIVHAGMGLVY